MTRSTLQRRAAVVPAGEESDVVSQLSALSRAELWTMHEAGAEVLACQRVLAKTGDTVVGELLRGQGIFYEWTHYPAGDVYDSETHSQYYYHAHPESERTPDEHGHFHTFLRPLGMPPGIRPAPVPDVTPPATQNDAISHLVGIAMDRAGLPIRLFTTNRWITGETWYAAEDVVRMLDHFAVEHARPSWPTNRWITAMIRLFRPQIAWLLRRRDQTVAERQAAWPRRNVLEDRDLAVTSELDIDIPEQIYAIEQALRAIHRTAGTDRAG